LDAGGGRRVVAVEGRPNKPLHLTGAAMTVFLPTRLSRQPRQVSGVVRPFGRASSASTGSVTDGTTSEYR
jgi:hypothetical protein